MKIILGVVVALLLLPIESSAARSDETLRNITARNIELDNTAGEDLRIRRAAIEALGNHAGTIVVMSAQSGRIYTIVNQNWGVRRGFKPCSTIKLVTGIAGISENLIAPAGDLRSGYYRIGLDDSLAYSNNSFFQKVGAGLGTNKMIAYARKLGFGEKTGINSRGEFQGRLPFGNGNLRIYSHADDFEVTPLQLAVAVSAITNGGKLLVPQTPKTSFQKSNFRGFYRRGAGIPANHLKRVIPGMIGAVGYGTAKNISGYGLKIAGKTGSCISNGTWVGLFASAAPITNPKFSIVVITEGQGARGKYSAAIAGRIYNSLRLRFSENYSSGLSRKNVSQLALVDEHKSQQPVARTASSRPIQYKNAKRKPAQEIPRVNDKAPKELFPTIIINGKREITRPRVVGNR